MIHEMAIGILIHILSALIAKIDHDRLSMLINLDVFYMVVCLI